MESLKRIYDINRERLNALSIPFREWQHEATLDFDTDIRVASELGWTGTHTKSLFLKLKGQGYAIYLTEKDSRLDAKQIKAVTGKRPSICDDGEMVEVLGCLPGAVCPIGLPEYVTLIVDTTLYQHEELLYTPGLPEFTFGFAGKHLKRLLLAGNHILYEI
ncbi:YbaK/EbsC family protein [Vibrio sp. CCB-PB317]|uniref:YbaK/EbsC family protein n=1 Tax=Vibrio sp. CCB-PB317 TaxID=2929171 RepID=UPI001FAC8D31|nr:YbaK/EbsC family protein [Vibrio sp. CCB-PB317]MCJ0883552.1 YbaK/EbsC family protein [Vibrio sp. CCB-PB317]